MNQEKYPYYTDEQAVPETPGPGAPPKPWGKTNVVGRRRPRVEGYELVSGRAVYPSDVSLPGILCGAVLRSPHPNAHVKRIDTRAAEQMPGVRAVFDGIESRSQYRVVLFQRGQRKAFRIPLPLRGRADRRRRRRDGPRSRRCPEGHQGRIRGPARGGRRDQVAATRRAPGP